MDHQKQKQQQRSGGSAGKHGGGKGSGKAGGGGSGGKKPIKVVYISNPMRVKTSAAGFRALVQELTGRHADPSKYSADDNEVAVWQELSPQGSAAASTPDVVAAPGPAAAPEFATPAFGDGDEDEIFGSQLLDNDDYPVFPPSTLLYDYPYGSNKV